MVPVGVLEIVIGEGGPLLFQLAFGDVPVAFDFEFVHGVILQRGPNRGDGVKPYRRTSAM
jgi:hypothetical protein